MPTKKTPTPPRRIDYLPVSEVQEAEVNPKEHDTPRIAGSVSRFGFADAPILDERTGRLVAGHGRLSDIRARLEDGKEPPEGIVVDEDGTWRMPVQRGWASRSDEDAAAFLVAHNRLGETGGWDDRSLVVMLEGLNDVDPGLLDLTGYTLDDVEAMGAFHHPADDYGGDFGEEDLQDALDAADRSAWPWIKAQVDPELHARFQAVPGVDDAQRLAALLAQAPEPGNEEG